MRGPIQSTKIGAAQYDGAGLPTGGYGAVNAVGPDRVLSFGLKLLF
jgi:hypothetical protein